MSKKIRVIIADDHPVFRRGLRIVVENDADLNVVADAENGVDALEAIKTFQPDVAVLDIDMPQKDGLEVAREIRKSSLSTEIIFLTMHDDEALLNASLDLGVRGYLLKDSAIADIVASIKAVVNGQNFVSPVLLDYLLKRASRTSAPQTNKLDLLTPTERRVLRMIAQEKTSREIAEELFVSIRTIEHHRSNIASKLDLRGTHALLTFALNNKTKL